MQPLLLFPFEDATPIADAARILDGRPVVLIVPDGTWRQASKVRRRVPGLADVKCVSVSGEGRLPYRLRAEAHAHGLSTIEAIARAMAILESEDVRADARESLSIDGGANTLDPRRARGRRRLRRDSRGGRTPRSARTGRVRLGGSTSRRTPARSRTSRACRCWPLRSPSPRGCRRDPSASPGCRRA